MKFIARAELQSAGTLSLTSIPDTYTDLMLVISARGANTPFLGMAFNGTSSGFTSIALVGDSSNAGSFSRTDTYVANISGSSYTANVYGPCQIYIANYASSNNKSYAGEIVGENNQSAANITLTAGLWSNSAAINSIQIYNWNSGDAQQGLATYTSATLYGITAGSDGTTTVS
jgi:hypothetical protein